jgi:sensor histidine kinase YesM
VSSLPNSVNYLIFLIAMAGITWLLLKGMPLVDKIPLKSFWKKTLQVFLIGNVYLLVFALLLADGLGDNLPALVSYEVKLMVISLAVVGVSEWLEGQAELRGWPFVKTQILSTLLSFLALSAALLLANYLLWQVQWAEEKLYLSKGFLNLNYIEFLVLLFMGFLVLSLRTLHRFQSFESQQLVRIHQAEIKELESAHQKAQLEVLQARLNPHFLHNSLNAIAALVYDFPERAERMTLALSRMFRYTLQPSGSPWVTLGEELEAATTYLEIEKIRFEEALTIDIQVAPETYSFLVPRLILQPLLENALKHGVSRNIGQGQVAISARLRSQQLILEIADNGPAFDEASPVGFGWQATQDKLRLLYGQHFSLERLNEPYKHVRIVLPTPPMQ